MHDKCNIRPFMAPSCKIFIIVAANFFYHTYLLTKLVNSQICNKLLCAWKIFCQLSKFDYFCARYVLMNEKGTVSPSLLSIFEK